MKINILKTSSFSNGFQEIQNYPLQQHCAVVWWLGVCVGDYFLHDVWQCWPMVGGYVWSRRYQTAGRYLLIDLDTETEQPVSSPAPASLRLLFYNQNVLRVS